MRLPKWGRQRALIRDDSTFEERERGYRVLTSDEDEAAALI